MSSVHEIKQLSVIDLESAQGEQKAILEKAQAQIGFIPNMYQRMVNSPALLDAYLHSYSLFRNKSRFNPVEQEVVFLTISRVNNCHYCIAAHSALAVTMSEVPTDITEAIRTNRTLPDDKLNALSEFVRVMLDSHGRPTPGQAGQFLDAGYDEQAMLDVILAIAVKTLSNYSNHLFNTPVDEMFQKYSL